MMQSMIWKIVLDITNDPQQRSMPMGSTIVRTSEQNGLPVLWYRHNDPGSFENHTFVIVGTGHKFDANYVYIGSCDCGPFVWHVLEIPV